MACAVDVLPVVVFVLVWVYSPVTNDGEAKMDWLADTFIGELMIVTHTPSGCTVAPVKRSTQLEGSVKSPSLLVAVLIVHLTSVLIAAVAFEEASCAKLAFTDSPANTKGTTV